MLVPLPQSLHYQRASGAAAESTTAYSALPSPAAFPSFSRQSSVASSKPVFPQPDSRAPDDRAVYEAQPPVEYKPVPPPQPQVTSGGDRRKTEPETPEQKDQQLVLLQSTR